LNYTYFQYSRVFSFSFLGAVHLFIDGHKWPDPVFLDYKPQLFDIVGKPHIFRFDDDFRSIVINSHKFPTNFGGQLPMVIYVGGVEHSVILGNYLFLKLSNSQIPNFFKLLFIF
jgi:hypothetical protein